MQQSSTRCIKRVGNDYKCPICRSFSIRYGKSASGVQRYKCKSCNKTFVERYAYMAYKKDITQKICRLLCESVCIRGIGRLLNIANNTVISRIIKAAAAILKPLIVLGQTTLEVDELKTYIKYKKNEYWIAYALDCNRRVVDYVVGKRTRKNLKRLVDTLLLSKVKQINTDNLPVYKGLIPKPVHKHGEYCINHIERNNLTLRMRLKRLSRKTLCYSKSITMLNACLKIYFWGPAS